MDDLIHRLMSSSIALSGRLGSAERSAIAENMLEAAAALKAAREDAAEAKQNGYELGLLAAAREDAKAVGTVLGGEFHYLRPNHGLQDGTMLYAIDQARGKGER